MPFLASAVRASDPFPATSVGAPEISVSGNLCATKLSAGKLILDHRCKTYLLESNLLVGRGSSGQFYW